MDAIRAHFDGSVIVPDEPVSLAPQARVVVLVESAEAPSTGDLERATQEYYCGLAGAEGAFDDDGWGEDVAHDSHKAWEEE